MSAQELSVGNVKSDLTRRNCDIILDKRGFLTSSCEEHCAVTSRSKHINRKQRDKERYIWWWRRGNRFSEPSYFIPDLESSKNTLWWGVLSQENNKNILNHKCSILLIRSVFHDTLMYYAADSKGWMQQHGFNNKKVTKIQNSHKNRQCIGQTKQAQQIFQIVRQKYQTQNAK